MRKRGAEEPGENSARAGNGGAESEHDAWCRAGDERVAARAEERRSARQLAEWRRTSAQLVHREQALERELGLIVNAVGLREEADEWRVSRTAERAALQRKLRALRRRIGRLACEVAEAERNRSERLPPSDMADGEAEREATDNDEAVAQLRRSFHAAQEKLSNFKLAARERYDELAKAERALEGEVAGAASRIMSADWDAPMGAAEGGHAHHVVGTPVGPTDDAGAAGLLPADAARQTVAGCRLHAGAAPRNNNNNSVGRNSGVASDGPAEPGAGAGAGVDSCLGEVGRTEVHTEDRGQVRHVVALLDAAIERDGGLAGGWAPKQHEAFLAALSKASIEPLPLPATAFVVAHERQGDDVAEASDSSDDEYGHGQPATGADMARWALGAEAEAMLRIRGSRSVESVDPDAGDVVEEGLAEAHGLGLAARDTRRRRLRAALRAAVALLHEFSTGEIYAHWQWFGRHSRRLQLKRELAASWRQQQRDAAAARAMAEAGQQQEAQERRAQEAARAQSQARARERKRQAVREWRAAREAQLEAQAATEAEAQASAAREQRRRREAERDQAKQELALFRLRREQQQRLAAKIKADEQRAAAANRRWGGDVNSERESVEQSSPGQAAQLHRLWQRDRDRALQQRSRRERQQQEQQARRAAPPRATSRAAAASRDRARLLQPTAASDAQALSKSQLDGDEKRRRSQKAHEKIVPGACAAANVNGKARGFGYQPQAFSGRSVPAWRRGV